MLDGVRFQTKQGTGEDKVRWRMDEYRFRQTTNLKPVRLSTQTRFGRGIGKRIGKIIRNSIIAFESLRLMGPMWSEIPNTKLQNDIEV
jgi:hypothetical protein